VAPIDAPAVATSLIAFIVVYFIVFGAGTFYVLRLFSHTPAMAVSVDEIGPTHASDALTRGHHG
jgi:cytochrome d ubiquinol oxidase subunit I